MVLATSPDGQDGLATPGASVLRSNVDPDVLRSFGEDLKHVAANLTAPPEPGDTTH
jgi:hypothetical protein